MAQADQTERLHAALEGALDRYAMVMEAPFPHGASLTVLPTSAFVALARRLDDAVEIVVSDGVVDAIETLWGKALNLSADMPDDLQFNVGDHDQAVDASLMWLMLHELHHHQIGHLELVGASGLSETSLPPELGLTSRSVGQPAPLDGVDPDDRLLIRRCLELQADHDALEILLDHYSDEGWEYIRFYMACAMAVMMIIDQQDQADDDQRTHPASATRVFQLIGVLAYLWQPTKGSQRDVPDDSEIQSFYEAVVVPSIGDAVLLATAAKTDSIVQSLEEIDVLLMDMQMIQEPDKFDLTQLKTAGAREYASLMASNAKAIELLGPEKFFI